MGTIEGGMTSRAVILQSDIERALRAAKKLGAVLIVEPRTGRMIIDPAPEPRIVQSPTALDAAEEPNPWEEGLDDAAP
ncbi:hypothetical protein NRB_26680 [Novosphingobium sp. 11B]